MLGDFQQRMLPLTNTSFIIAPTLPPRIHMPTAKDPTEAMRAEAAALPDVVEGSSCTQTSFKIGKTAFLYIGPGAKGVGFKAMMKLDQSLAKVREMAEKEPDRYSGSTGWVTLRFSADKPIPKTLWKKWIRESYQLAAGGGKKTAKKPAMRKR